MVSNTQGWAVGGRQSASAGSGWAGISIKMTIAENESFRTERGVWTLACIAIQAPGVAAIAWLTNVAVRIPQTIGQRLRKRAASTSASNCVLSPIASGATRPVDVDSGSIRGLKPQAPPPKLELPHDSGAYLA